MKAAEVPFDFEMTDASGRSMGQGRSVGLHLSQIIKYMRTAGKGEKLDAAGGEKFMMTGFILEMMLEEMLGRFFGQYVARSRGLIVTQQELHHDGIYLTPDAYNAKDQRSEEYKATWRSMRKLYEPGGLVHYFWHYLVQVKAACYVMGTTKALLVIFFVNGDYTHQPPNGGPQIRAIELEFGEDELEKNWEMLKVNGQDMLEKGLA